MALWKRDRIAWILLLGALSVPAFHAFQVFTGRLGPYTRYWIDFVPWVIPMLGYLLALAARGRRRPLTRNGARLAAVALLALSTVTTAHWMYSPPPEFGANFYDINELYVTHFWFGGDRLDQLREATKKPTELNDVAAFLDQEYPEERILIDQWHGHPIILQLADPGRVVMTNDRNFFEILENPIGRVDLFAVAKFDGVSPHVIESAYPVVWQFGRPWLELEAEVGRADSPWRIFRVRLAP